MIGKFESFSGRVDLLRAIVTVGTSKTEAGEGRTIPQNSDVLAALIEHPKWFLKKKFGETRPAKRAIKPSWISRVSKQMLKHY